MSLFICKLIYHGVGCLWVLSPLPHFLDRKRMEIRKKRIINVSHKDKWVFSIERNGGEGGGTAWVVRSSPELVCRGRRVN